MSADILVVDDEVDIRELVAGILEDEGNRTRTAGTSDEALAAIETRRPHLVFLDIWLQGSRLDGPSGSGDRQVPAPGSARRDDLGPRQYRDGGLQPSRPGPTTSSRSRSRPTGSCSSPSAPLRRRA